MTSVSHLVTHVDLDEAATNTWCTSVSARLEAVLVDGRSLVLLKDRGWSWSSSGSVDAGTRISADDVEKDALVVVGTDEPNVGEIYEQKAAGHWDFLASLLRQQGVGIDAQEMARLSHDVVLSERLRAWIA
jgi:hypothetical protein